MIHHSMAVNKTEVNTEEVDVIDEGFWLQPDTHFPSDCVMSIQVMLFCPENNGKCDHHIKNHVWNVERVKKDKRPDPE